MRHWILFIIYLSVVIVIALTPNPLKDIASNNQQYLLHAFEYFILSVLALNVMFYHNSKHPYRNAILISILIAVFTEFLQIFLTYRTFNPIDILFDTLGSFFVLIWRKNV